MANILVVDDDADFRSMLRLMLTRLGHNITVAPRGEDGFAQAAATRFDLLIVDLMMPDVDGYELIRRLRAEPATQNTPILVITARSQPTDRESAREAGADGYLTKPVDARELSSRITEVIAAPRPERPKEPESALKPAAAVTAGVPSPAAATGRVTVLIGLRGGVGRTTIAVNLAGALSRLGRRVCLVDFSPNGGQVPIHLRARPQSHWGDLPATVDSKAAAQVVTRHDSGLFIVAAPPKPARTGLSVEAAQSLLTQLRTSFAEVVVDAAPVLDDATVAALSVCRYTVLVLSPDIGAVQTAIGTVRALPGLSVFDEQVKVLLNNPSHEAQVPQAAVEKALGRALDAVVPFDPSQAAAVAQGIPLVAGAPSAPLVYALTGFAAGL